MAQIPLATPADIEAEIDAHAAAIDPHAGYVQPADLATVATTGVYTDLSGRPTIPDSADDIGAQPAGNYLRRVIHNGTSYPTRPVGVPAGLVEYVGPTQPTDWLDGDTWIQTS
jgi:hypothetical protein